MLNSVSCELWEKYNQDSMSVLKWGRVAIYVTRDGFLAKVTCGWDEVGVIQGWVGYGMATVKTDAIQRGFLF